MDVRPLTPAGAGWAAEVLARRRAALVPHAPVYWRPAADAVARHRDFLASVLGAGGGIGFRTEDGLMIATRGPRGWTVDDAWVPPDRWERDGAALWDRTIAGTGDGAVRFVCPVAEPERTAFARRRGLAPATSWWHAEVPPVPGPGASAPRVDGSDARLVPAPPVYDPGGPILFLRDVRDVAAVARSRAEAARCGAPLVVVDQPAGAGELGRALAEHRFVRHCDFLDG